MIKTASSPRLLCMYNSLDNMSNYNLPDALNDARAGGQQTILGTTAGILPGIITGKTGNERETTVTCVHVIAWSFLGPLVRRATTTDLRLPAPLTLILIKNINTLLELSEGKIF